MNGPLVFLHVIVSILIVVVVLLQPATKSSGFGSTFSGGCATDSAFGARGPIPFLMKLTYWLAAAIMLTSLMLEINIIKKSWSVLDTESVVTLTSNAVPNNGLPQDKN
jgi:protein translocase SecG subunit